MKTFVAILTAVALPWSATGAATVSVEVTGIVIFNGIGAGPLSGVGSAETATLYFEVNSDDFVDGVPGDTRGYPIDESSLSLSFSGGVTVGLLSPFPAGETPFFTLVEGFPVSDGFFVSTSPISPGGVPLEQAPVNLNLDLGYDGGTLATLDILDAIGVYDFTGLTRFAFNLWQVVPDNVGLDIDYTQMRIEEVITTPAQEASWGGIKALFE